MNHRIELTKETANLDERGDGRNQRMTSTKRNYLIGIVGLLIFAAAAVMPVSAGTFYIQQYGTTTTTTFQLVTYGATYPANDIIYAYGLAPGQETVKVIKSRVTPGAPVTFTVKDAYAGQLIYVNARQAIASQTSNQDSNEIAVQLQPIQTEQVKPLITTKKMNRKFIVHRWNSVFNRKTR